MSNCYPSPESLQNFQKDVETTAEYANGDNGVPNVNRDGENVGNLQTLNAQALAIAAGAANLQTYLTKAAMDADTSQPVPTVGQVTNDPDPANNKYYVWNGSTWELSGIQPADATELAAIKILDALTINRFKPYPLRSATRAGVTSAEPTWFSNVLLSVGIFGAVSGKVYRIGYQRNAAATAGSYLYGWTFTEHNAADYAGADAGAATIHNYTDPAPDIDRAGGIQVISITPVNRPDLLFKIVIDAAQLPAEGSPLDSNSSNTRAGWSWIVDPSCYFARPKNVDADSLTINHGKVMPLRISNRGGTTSTSADSWRNLLLDVKVTNAEVGKLYRVAYQQNGAVLSGASRYDWIIEEFPAATYETAPERTIILSYLPAQGGGTQQQIIPDGSIQTVHLFPPTRPGLMISLTVDTAALPAGNLPLNAYSDSSLPVWSWIVDPSRYEQQATAWDFTGILWDYEATTKTLTTTWRSGTEMRRQTFGPKGINGIPDIKAEFRAPLGNPETAVWTTIIDVSAGGDMTPPICNFADANGDGNTDLNYTGGNHGSDGGAGGSPTGRNLIFTVMPDGQPVSTTSSGTARTILMEAVNRVFAANTISLGRETMEQRCHYRIGFGSTELRNKWTALEALRVVTDNGIQTFTTGLSASGTLQYYGKTNTRVAFTSVTNSGAKSEFPNVWAVSFRNAANGELVSWMDRSYEAGDGRYVSASRPMIRGGGSTNSKFYHAAVSVAGEADWVPMGAGQSYEWRGGWQYRAAPLAIAGFDGAVTIPTEGNAEVRTINSSGLSV